MDNEKNNEQNLDSAEQLEFAAKAAAEEAKENKSDKAAAEKNAKAAEKKSAKAKSSKEKDEKDKQEESKKALESALARIEKSFGKGAIMKLGEVERNIGVHVIPTGCLELDLALGVGGVPRGRIIELYGPESSGKTTVALHMIAETQSNGGTAAFIDAEHALDPVYAKTLGVDIDNLYVSQPDTGEQGLEICEALSSSGAVDIIVVDSVAALVPKAEIEGQMGASHVGLQARLMSQALRKLAGVVSKSDTVVVFINQLREKVGQVYGNPEVTPGGRALKFYSSIRLEVRKGEYIKEGDKIIGAHTKIKVAKNKVAPPFKIAEVDMYYGQGISKEASVLNMALTFGIITKSGSWFSYGSQRVAQGRENVRKKLSEDPAFYEEVKAKVMREYRPEMIKDEAPGEGEGEVKHEEIE